MRVLFVQQDHVSPTGPVGEAFADRGYDVQELLVVPEEHFAAPAIEVTFPDPTQYDAIVPMGAPWSVYDHEKIGTWIRDEIDFLRTAHEAGVPVLGICFGGQALAAALGGAVIPSEHPEVGWTTISSDDVSLVEPGPWFQWHGDRWVLPEGVSALARTDVADQAFVVNRSMGLQFHPELTPAMLEGWLGNGGDLHAVSLGVDPAMLRSETLAQGQASAERAGRLVNRFLDSVATVELS